MGKEEKVRLHPEMDESFLERELLKKEGIQKTKKKRKDKQIRLTVFAMLLVAFDCCKWFERKNQS